MSKVIKPSDPLRADHRMIKEILRTIGKDDKVQHLPHEYEFVVGLFNGLDGSWEHLFKGSVEHTVLLKKIIKWCLQNKRLSPAPKWAGKVR